VICDQPITSMTARDGTPRANSIVAAVVGRRAAGRHAPWPPGVTPSTHCGPSADGPACLGSYRYPGSVDHAQGFRVGDSTSPMPRGRRPGAETSGEEGTFRLRGAGAGHCAPWPRNRFRWSSSIPMPCADRGRAGRGCMGSRVLTCAIPSDSGPSGGQSSAASRVNRPLRGGKRRAGAGRGVDRVLVRACW